jgi:hypothetical protein
LFQSKLPATTQITKLSPSPSPCCFMQRKNLENEGHRFGTMTGQKPLTSGSNSGANLVTQFLNNRVLQITVRNVTAVPSLLFSRKVTRYFTDYTQNFNSFKTAQNYNSTQPLLNCGITLGSNKSLHWAGTSCIIL